MKKKSIIVFLLPFILIIASCIGIMQYDLLNSGRNYSYSQQDNNIQIRKDYLQSYTFELDLLRFCYAIDYNDRYDLNVSSEKNLHQLYGQNLSTYLLNQMDNFIISANDNLQYDYSFLKYHMLDLTDSSTYSNSGELSMNDSGDVYKITFDENGEISIETSSSINVPIKTAYTNLIRNNFQSNYTGNSETIELLKNRVFTFVVEKSADLSSLVSYNNNVYIYKDYSYHMNAVLFSFVVLAVLGLCLPLKKLRQFSFYQNIIDIPLEILVIVSLGFLTFSSRYIASNFFYNNPLSVMLYAILAFIFLMDVLVFKYFLQYPPLQYIKERSLTAQVASFVFDNMKQFDLAEKYNLTLFKVVIVNAFAIIILPMWMGVIGLIIYCVLLFIIMINVANQVKNDYQSLLEVTSSIASGKFDKTTNTDLGVFNSYKDSMDTIRDDFKNAVDSEIRSEKMKTELITSVSHDLKTPLTSIVTYADLLKDDQLDNDKKKEYIAVIDRNALRLKNLINDLFEVSKASSGNITLNLMEIDIISLIKQAILEYDHLFEKQGLQLKFTSNQEKSILKLDSQKTYRIITNLLVNISKYAMENTRVYIDVTDTQNKVEITLKNISKHEIRIEANELLERFVQGDSSRHSEGSGLGLAITKTFTELQGGTCQVSVDGDLFKVTLVFNK